MSILILPYLASPVQAQLETQYNDDIKVDVINISIRKVKQRESGIRVDKLSPDNQSTWGRITCEYLVSKSGTRKAGVYSKEEVSWLDECTFSWRIMLLRSNTKGGPASKSRSVLLQRDITYGNIIAHTKRKHYAVVYIEPSILVRYGNSLVKGGIIVHLQITQGDSVIASSWATGKHTVSGKDIPLGFLPSGSQSSWFDSEDVQALKFGLVSRLETPWAWSSYGSYEFILDTLDKAD